MSTRTHGDEADRKRKMICIGGTRIAGASAMLGNIQRTLKKYNNRKANIHITKTIPITTSSAAMYSQNGIPAISAFITGSEDKYVLMPSKAHCRSAPSEPGFIFQP
jgi:hypothetical protein